MKHLGRLIGAVVALALTFLIVQSLPDIARYLKIRAM